jgi:hypothetical protein
MNIETRLAKLEAALNIESDPDARDGGWVWTRRPAHGLLSVEEFERLPIAEQIRLLTDPCEGFWRD